MRSSTPTIHGMELEDGHDLGLGLDATPICCDDDQRMRMTGPFS